MHFEIKRGKNGDVELVGDQDFYFWLTTAAGNARSGRKGNSCEATKGKGTLHLTPLEPIHDAPPAGKRNIAEVAIRKGNRRK